MRSTAHNAMLLMIGSSIVLALSLGIRHAFGLFFAADEPRVWLGP